MNDISIIIPIYNAEKFLKKSINSLLNQTYKDFELILVNDGSIDKSLSICESYAKKDKRIKIINQSNAGAVSARRRGIEMATGEYIIFVDADDWVDRTLVHKLYNEILKEQSDICVCKRFKTLNKFTHIKKDINGAFDKFYSQRTKYGKEEIRDIIVKSFFFSGCFPCTLTAKIYKKSLFGNSGKYAKLIKFYGEDIYLNFELFLKDNKVVLLDEVLYYYRKGGGTSNYMKDYFDDLVSGLNIKYRIIDRYYENLRDEILPVMYMNFFELYKSCIFNLAYSEFDKTVIKQIIKGQLENEAVINAVSFMKDKNFDIEFVKAISEKNVEYLYRISMENRRKRFFKDRIMKII